jgi:hypothetical protein
MYLHKKYSFAVIYYNCPYAKKMQRREINKCLTLVAMIFFAAIFVCACQNKRAAKTMNDKESICEPDSSYRLLTIAKLEQAGKGIKAIAWFFETPQIFELALNTNQAQGMYNLLKEAKQKGLPVNVRGMYTQNKNMIIMVIPATENQLNQYTKQKSQLQKAWQIKPPEQ